MARTVVSEYGHMWPGIVVFGVSVQTRVQEHVSVWDASFQFHINVSGQIFGTQVVMRSG